MAQRFIVIAEIGRPLFLRLFKAQRRGPDRDAIAVLQQMFELLFAVDKDLVRASFDLTGDRNAIDNHERAIGIRRHMRVVPRRPRVVKYYLVVGRAPNHARHTRFEWMLCLASAGVGNFQLSHTGSRSADYFKAESPENDSGTLILQGKYRFSLAAFSVADGTSAFPALTEVTPPNPTSTH